MVKRQKRVRRSLYLTTEFEQRMRSLHKHEPDLKYWLHHVLHWHALMFAVMGIVAFTEMNYPQLIPTGDQNTNIQISAQ